jgi:hypothetical protein
VCVKDFIKYRLFRLQAKSIPNVQGVSKILRQISGLNSTHHNDSKISYQCLQANTLFSRYSPTMCWPESHILFTCGDTWNSQCIQLHGRVHGRKCQRVHWFRWRTFWASVVNCYLVNSKNWTVTKLGTCTVNISCQVPGKYYIVTVFIVECNHSITLKNHISQKRFIWLLCSNVNNSLLT